MAKIAQRCLLTTDKLLSSENRDISDQPSSNDGTTGNDPNGSSSEISESNGEGASGSQGSGSRSEGEGASGSQGSSSESVEGSSLGEGGDPGSSGSGSSSSESGTSGSEPSRSGTGSGEAGSSAQIINTEDEILEARDNITLAERIKLSTTLLKHFSLSEMQTFMQLASGGLNQKEKKAARDVFMDRLSPKEYDDLIVIAAKYGLSQGKKYEEHLDK